MRVIGARENNLKNLTVRFPLGMLVCVTGVSGSGKSTLIDQVLYRNLRRQMGLQMMEPGACKTIEGAGANFGRGAGRSISPKPQLPDERRHLHEDPGPPADGLRRLTARPAPWGWAGRRSPSIPLPAPAPIARARVRTGGAAVPAGCLHPLPGCDGRRFRLEVLEVRCRGHNIAERVISPGRRRWNDYSATKGT